MRRKDGDGAGYMTGQLNVSAVVLEFRSGTVNQCERGAIDLGRLNERRQCNVEKNAIDCFWSQFERMGRSRRKEECESVKE